MGLERIGSTNKIDDHDICACRIRGKQISLCIPRSPKCGGKEKARDFGRDDARIFPSVKQRRRITAEAQGTQRNQRQRRPPKKQAAATKAKSRTTSTAIRRRRASLKGD